MTLERVNFDVINSNKNNLNMVNQETTDLEFQCVELEITLMLMNKKLGDG